MKKTVSLTLAAAAAVTVTVTLSSCSLGSDMFSNQTESRYSTYADFSDDAEPYFRSAGWVPSDSTTIALKYFKEKRGNMMSFTSATGVGADSCLPGELTGEPLLEASWWPSSEPAEGVVCDSEWQVFEHAGIWHAWTN